MLSIIKEPYELSLSKNEIIWEAETNMLYETNGYKPVLRLKINDKVSTGDVFIFSFLNPKTGKVEKVQYTGATDDTNDDFKFYSGPMAVILPIIYSNKILRSTELTSWYDIDVDIIDSTITFTAKEESKDLVLKYSTNNTTGCFSVLQQDSDSILSEERYGYSLKAHVFFERIYGNNDFEHVAEIQCMVDTMQRTIIDISSVLDSEIEASFDQLPVPWQQPNVFKSNNLKRYYIKFVEEWSEEENASEIISDVKLVHWGGMSFDDQEISDIYNLVKKNTHYLTWTRNSKKIANNQDDWLSAMNFGIAKEFKLYKVIKATNTVQTQTLIGTHWMNPFETLVWNVGYEVNNISSSIPSGERLEWWGFFIENELPLRKYYLDSRCEYKIIAYLNPFGIFETMSTAADWAESMNVKQTLAVRSQNFRLSTLFPQNFIFDSKNGSSYTANTPSMPIEDAKRLQGMLNATMSFIREKNRWIPAVIESGSKDISIMQMYLGSIEINIFKANESDRVSWFDLQPDIEVHEDYGIEYFNIRTNGLQITNYGLLEIYSYNGSGTISTLEYTFSWDGQKYFNATPFTKEGIFEAKVLIIDSEGNQHVIRKIIKYRQKTIDFIWEGTGTFTFYIFSTIGDSINLDWGDGVNETKTITSDPTTISHTFSGAQVRRIITLKKPNFKGITNINTNRNIGHFDYTQMPELSNIQTSFGYGGNMYLSALSKIVALRIYDQNARSLNIGFQKNLTVLHLRNLQFSSDSFLILMTELWNFRKLYTTTPAITIQNIGVSTPAVVNDIINGTGDYSGEGLVSNYGWTITIT